MFSGFPSESVGAFRLSLFNDQRVLIENHGGIAGFSKECIKVFSKKRIVAVNGEMLEIREFDEVSILVSGKIKSIEYLT